MECNVQIKIDLFRCCHSVSHEMAVLGALEAHEMACSDMSEIPNLSVLDVWVTGVASSCLLPDTDAYSLHCHWLQPVVVLFGPEG